MIRLIDYLRARQGLVRSFIIILVSGIMVWSLTVDTGHAHTWLEKHIPAFWSIFALLSCVVLIFTARWLAAAGIAKEEDYYDN